ncbi:WLM domain-containing protein [Lentinula raphanica]|nr:WLM domain-containing protein [Lentinula raphanica]
MVHSRFNEKETNPNPHINFITPLPADDSEDARQLLRALAAQVRPIMKAHAFTVNSLEEYEHNVVFAGRNWNNGETIELVLRRPGGSFLPSSWLMSTLCHELAHNTHMNHGPAFQALWRTLRNEVRQLQNRGYYGDGCWSAGTRLADSVVVPGSGMGLDTGDLPEYICGGAQSKTRPSHLRQRRGPRPPREVVASNKTGKQTAKQRKAGSRVTSKYAFQGEGLFLGTGDKGLGYRKQAHSKRAREERALAIERRTQALGHSSIPTGSSTSSTASTSNSGEDDCLEDTGIIFESNTDRKQALLDANQDSDEFYRTLSSRTAWQESQNDFIYTGQGCSDVVISSLDESGPITNSKSDGKRKTNGFEQTAEPPTKIRKKASLNMGLGRQIETKPASQKREASGMTDKGLTMSRVEKRATVTWSCLVCTLENQPLHLACAACNTEKGRSSLNVKTSSILIRKDL